MSSAVCSGRCRVSLYRGFDSSRYRTPSRSREVSAAISLAADETNTVTLSAIDKEFTYPKKRNIDKVRALEAEGRLQILLGSSVKAFGEESAEVTLADGSNEQVKYDTAFEMIGAELPIPFFNKVGIKLANQWDAKRWIGLIVIFLMVYSLYSLNSFG